jgi:hypothetical protein
LEINPKLEMSIWEKNNPNSEYYKIMRNSWSFHELFNIGKQFHELHPGFLFGPPNIITLNKISGHDPVQNNSYSSAFHPLSYWHSN